ncbi:hypothetical protein HY02_09025 [Peptococcaceae bacterium SCADC1_2_3]|jgi:hypothetical protein|nr:hypothetical protein DK28_0200785 [Peptococcaceae bacterium SCADC1_2_3]KFI35288.1 hypothetical protein HY00_05790 [Peptococcaceae bacterium SCADC1_2_3]KFI38064.1 hypothetical protein HY02_09025 [Peptococcaceae bacterium SCADC1_2_3]
MEQNKFFWGASFGLFFGMVVFGVQVSLGALNDTLQLKEPLKFGQIEKTSSGVYQIKLLGKNWTIYLPEKNLPLKSLLENKDYDIRKLLD